MACDPVLLDFARTAAGEFEGWGPVTPPLSAGISPDQAVRLARAAFAASETFAPVVCLGQTTMPGDDGPRAVYAVIWADNDQLDAVWIDAGRGLVLLTPAGRP
jgi:hypothetical protein